MASNRSITEPTSASALAALARDGSRIQMAALGAAGHAFAGWARAADRFGQAVAAAAATHLQELTVLPSAATDNFDARLARVSTDD